MQSERENFLNVIKNECIGKPYIWGEKGPDAFDCSGVVSYAMRKSGFSTIGNLCVKALYDKFKDNESYIKPGCLLFYGKPDDLVHVMICLSEWPIKGLFTLAGATHGSSDISDVNTAWDRRAFVGIYLSDYWHNSLQFIVDPFKE